MRRTFQSWLFASRIHEVDFRCAPIRELNSMWKLQKHIIHTCDQKVSSGSDKFLLAIHVYSVQFPKFAQMIRQINE